MQMDNEVFRERERLDQSVRAFPGGKASKVPGKGNVCVVRESVTFSSWSEDVRTVAHAIFSFGR